MSRTAQQKAVLKTVLLLIGIMVVILALFFNKITTPRYLSLIELKINGLIFLTQPQLITIDQQPDRWLLVANTEEQRQLLAEFEPQLKKSLKKHTQIINPAPGLAVQLSEQLPNYPDDIAIINPQQQLVGYFKPPYDIHKMLLTYSSVLTHRH